MARRRRNEQESLAAMPWPVGVIAGIVAYAAVHFLPALFASSANPILRGIAQGVAGGPLRYLAWLLLAMCWIAAGASYVRSLERRRLLDTQRGIDSIADLSWREFELLVGEAYRRQGYAVEETGQGGADGGVDLILRKAGRTTLVQCKQWRRRQVSVSTVREMWGLRAHHGADDVVIVCVGDYTRDATAFSAGKAIQLISGAQLMQLVDSVRQAGHARPMHRIEPTLQPVVVAPEAPPRVEPCPRCGAGMVERVNRKTREVFWGCSTFPACRGRR